MVRHSPGPRFCLLVSAALVAVWSCGGSTSTQRVSADASDGGDVDAGSGGASGSDAHGDGDGDAHGDETAPDGPSDLAECDATCAAACKPNPALAQCLAGKCKCECFV